MRILVTGGAGFIGSHIVDQLVADGHEVRTLDLLLPLAHAGVPDYLNPSAEFIRGDVADPATISSALAGVDAVCHQAAMVGLGVDFGDAPAYIRHNDLGTGVLLGALAARGFRGRLVLASSMVVYGEGRYRCSAHGEVAPAPRVAAGARARAVRGPVPGMRAGRWSRWRSTNAADSIPATSTPRPSCTRSTCAPRSRGRPGASLITLRYHNVYGPRMPRDTPYAGVASIFASALAAGRAPEVYEDGGQLRDFVHVRDVARANALATRGAGGARRRLQRRQRAASLGAGDGASPGRCPRAGGPRAGGQRPLPARGRASRVRSGEPSSPTSWGSTRASRSPTGWPSSSTPALRAAA